MSVFASKKEKILSQLSIPDEVYTDLSPKGTIDAGIRGLVDEINQLDGFVTTSSCAGRVAVFLEGSKKKHTPIDDDEKDQSGSDAIAGVGGKGGGRWLFVSHDPVDLQGLQDDVGLLSTIGIPTQDKIKGEDLEMHDPNACQLLHLKFEPLVCNFAITLHL
jgi:tRNA wybutosine-synthesizing protein 3